MGQCSTLPTDTRPSYSVVSSRHEQVKEMLMEEHRLHKEEGRKGGLDFNKLEAMDQNMQMENRRSSRMESMSPKQQARDPDAMRAVAETPVAMDVDSRDAVQEYSTPPPPAAATHTRCYKLNLDSEITGLSSSQKQHLCLGPFAEAPPPLTYSSSEDSSLGVDATAVAVRTAQIFRGITVGRDGTILTQNARATRSSRGKTSSSKRGEKSRQASKIDKAKDLVEESIATGKAPNSNEPANMVSLYIVGEYDDMKYLVRDGAKKLRDASGSGLTDEHLMTVNRSRHRGQQVSRPVASSSVASSILSPRKRVSPSLVSSQRTAALQSPEKLQMLPQSAPPRLKSHPRDNRPSRREIPKMRLDACHDFMDPRHAGGAVGDADWSHAWNIWNCGGASTASPNQPSSPRDNAAAAAYEEARESVGNPREGASVTRVD
jgi:hypothetical protein